MEGIKATFGSSSNELDDFFNIPPLILACQTENDINYTGNDIENAMRGNVNSYQECAQVCALTTGCEVWTYKPSLKKCWPKISVTGRNSWQGAISGPKSCAGKNLSPISSFVC